MLGPQSTAPRNFDEGHRAPPKILKKPTAIQSLTSTVQSWSQYTSPGRTALSKQARRLSDGVPALSRFLPPAAAAYVGSDGAQATAVSPGGQRPDAIDEADFGDEWGADKALGGNEEAVNGGGSRVKDSPCVWSTWDELLTESGHSRRVLISIFGAPLRGLQIWDFSDPEDVIELLNTQGSHDFEGVVAARILRAPPPAQEHDAAWDAAPLLALICVKSERAKSRSTLRLVSLRTGKIVKRIKLEGNAVEMKVNEHFIVISTSDPPALHVISSPSLTADPCSPILDVVPHPIHRAPPFDLGRSRLLVYATSRRMPQDHFNGIAAGKGWRGHIGSDDLDSGAAQVGKVARLVGGSVMTGVKALGNMGYQYWNAQQGQGQGMPEPDSHHSFSKSAPQPSNMPSALAGPGSASPPSAIQIAVDPLLAGHVLVVDLKARTTISSSRRSSRPHAAQPRTIAHFRPSGSPVALLSFNADSTHVLTGPVEGHSFHIFEIHPFTRISQASTSSAPPEQADHASVWHRYRLDRGRTAACPVKADWSSDGKFVAVVSNHGTTHVYGIRPDGGVPYLDTQFSAIVENPSSLQPLSVPLAPLTRIRAPSPWTLHDGDARIDELGNTPTPVSVPSFCFMSPLESSYTSPRLFGTSTAAKPRSPNSLVKRGDFIDPRQSHRDMLFFYPALGHAALSRVSARLVADPATASIDVRDTNLRSVSGLSQMMRAKATGAAPGVRLHFFSSFLAAWNVARSDDWEEMATRLFPPIPEQAVDWSNVAYHWASQIEINTFSPSSRILPRAIYLSHQFTFHHLPTTFAVDAASGDFHRKWAPVKVRDEVEISEGDEGRSVPFGEDTTVFGEPIRTAMDTFLDPQRSFLPGSPSSLTPTFPNGVPGKHGRGWNDGLPLRVPPNVYDGFGRLRREIGRVTTTRQRSSGSYPVSVSFEDDDVVFAAPTSDPGSYPAPSLSHGGSASDSNSGPLTNHGDDEDGWGWGVDEADEGQPRKAGRQVSESSPTMPHDPNDDDWGDFAPGLLDEEAPQHTGPALVAPRSFPPATQDALGRSSPQDHDSTSSPRKESILDLVPPSSWSTGQSDKASAKKSKSKVHEGARRHKV